LLGVSSLWKTVAFSATTSGESVTLRVVTTTSSVSHSAYLEILRAARRFVLTDDDAHDLAQDTLMIALHRGFDDWSAPARRAWLHGVLRRRAAFVARTEGRRRRREQVMDTNDSKVATWAWSPSFLTSLPASLRAVALLASADLSAAEICWLLQLKPAALRARLSALRRAVSAEAEFPTLPAPEPQIALGKRRAPVLAGLKRLPGQALATHDPDGHTILFRVVAHKTMLRGNT
jgi:RNA polymerase sigma-70 factor (ECF subfamily)